MAESQVVQELLDFLNASPTPFHAVREAASRLEAAGFSRLSEREPWNCKTGDKCYFTRNFSTIAAFAIGHKYKDGNGYYIVGAHTDSPCPKLKPKTKVSKGGFLEVGVQTYGGGLWHTWFDRDLTIAGRAVVKRVKKGAGDPPALEEVTYSHELVNLREPILRIPTLAIHLDRNVNDGFKVNTQLHFDPVLATAIKAEVNKPATKPGEPSETSDGKICKVKAVGASEQETRHHPILLQLLASEIGCEAEEIADFELQVCDTQPSALGGALKEFIFSGRLDNLCMSFCALKAFIDSTSNADLEEEEGVRMVALFDHEEVGSDSAQGAGSPVMFDALKRITSSFLDKSHYFQQGLIEQAIQRSFVVSADMAHCLHPNYQDKHEDNHQPKMHKGLVIKHNANQRYATNAVTAFLFREIAKRHGIPTQDFVVRNDMPCGSTIGPILASGVGVRTVDIGIPQLSMHSIREMCGVGDVGHAYSHIAAFYREFGKLDKRVAFDF